GAGGVGQEPRAIWKRSFAAARDVQIGFVQQAGGAQGQGRAAPQLALRQTVQFRIQNGKQLLARLEVAAFRRSDEGIEVRFRHFLESYLPSSVATYAATSRICAKVSAAANGGMLFLPEITVFATSSATLTWVMLGPPPWPPLPSAPWQAAQPCANTAAPAAGFP